MNVVNMRYTNSLPISICLNEFQPIADESRPKTINAFIRAAWRGRCMDGTMFLLPFPIPVT